MNVARSEAFDGPLRFPNGSRIIIGHSRDEADKYLGLEDGAKFADRVSYGTTAEKGSGIVKSLLWFLAGLVVGVLGFVGVVGGWFAPVWPRD